ncbi:hypothetical protein GCM10027598_60510 [Amycolatopsis oliviviridis]|uniref:Uncharacterized protein n=1 Tax=Amycolatopsis oliviviridis TaxID=1471590 RepID=A0ABQ3MEU7_9PSEU|nr:hypothetical protein GCM10017790_83680 [Amycolatopsis oliviviridis]
MYTTRRENNMESVLDLQALAVADGLDNADLPEMISIESGLSLLICN